MIMGTNYDLPFELLTCKFWSVLKNIVIDKCCLHISHKNYAIV